MGSMNRPIAAALALAAWLILPGLARPAVSPEPAGVLAVRLKIAAPDLPGGATLLAFRPASNLIFARLLGPVPGEFTPERDPQLSEDMIVVAAFDDAGAELASVRLVDPRLVRAEWEDESGRLNRRILYRSEAEFTVAFPDIPGIREFRLFQPVWDGRTFTLVALGTTRSGEGRR
jgi:hypothetical protein